MKNVDFTSISLAALHVPSARTLAVTTLCLGMFAACGTRVWSSPSDRSASESESETTAKENLTLSSGLITVARQIPVDSTATVQSTPADHSALGFLPTEPLKSVAPLSQSAALIVDRRSGTVTLVTDDKVVATEKAEGLDRLNPGSYAIVHKQKHPLWYAPDSYFSARKIPLPAAHDKERFRKGALGEFALFIDKETAIHSGPVYSNEVGGIRLSEDAIAQLYYRIPVGTKLEIR